MDHDYAPDLALGPVICAALRKVTRAPLEVHLMARPLDGFVGAFARAGADVITFHPEESDDVHRSAMRVREHGCKVGIALNPATPLGVLDPVLEDIDQVLVMWASPGPEGQRFLPSVLRRIRALRERISAAGRDVAISVEGGVETGSAAELVGAGADTLVVGSALCRSTDRAATIAALKGAAPSRPDVVAGERAIRSARSERSR